MSETHSAPINMISCLRTVITRACTSRACILRRADTHVPCAHNVHRHAHTCTHTHRGIGAYTQTHVHTNKTEMRMQAHAHTYKRTLTSVARAAPSRLSSSLSPASCSRLFKYCALQPSVSLAA